MTDEWDDPTDWSRIGPRDPDAFIKSSPKAKRPRRPSIRTIEKESGRTVTTVTTTPDGTCIYTLGEPGAPKVTPLEAWKAKHARSA